MESTHHQPEIRKVVELAEVELEAALIQEFGLRVDPAELALGHSLHRGRSRNWSPAGHGEQEKAWQQVGGKVNSRGGFFGVEIE